MSKFQSTISVIAALASIFGVASASWKLAESNKSASEEPIQLKYEEKITELQKELSDFKQRELDNVAPSPDNQTAVSPQVPVTTPQLPEYTTPPPPPTDTPNKSNFE